MRIWSACRTCATKSTSRSATCSGRRPTARRYQALKEQERRLTAELLALRLRELDSGAQVQDGAVRERDLAMQAALAEQRAAEAAIERQRAVHGEHGETLAAVQARYYEIGADITRTEQSIEHTRELRERQRTDLAQTHATLAELAAHIERDEQQLATLREELARLAPERAAAQQAESQAAAAAGSGRAGPAALAAALGGAHERRERRGPERAGRARAHRAAGEPVAAPRGAGAASRARST